jgi:hypothetical protein
MKRQRGASEIDSEEERLTKKPSVLTNYVWHAVEIGPDRIENKIARIIASPQSYSRANSANVSHAA